MGTELWCYIVQNSVNELKKTKGRQTFEVNVCAIIFVCEIGCSYRSLEQFTCCMNMFCLTESAYTNSNSNEIYTGYESAAKASMKKVDELHSPTLL